jgi:predicted lipoprotein with Yx(FWY)xxD motif
MGLKRTAANRAGGFVALAGVALLVAACGGGGSSSSDSTGSASSGSGTTTNTSAPSSSGGSAVQLSTASGSDGTYLTDESGRAVYLWVADGNGSSSCMGSCAQAWPPLTTTGKPAASSGVNAGDLGTIARSDGTKQVTYKGHPLYYYAGDSGSGQTTGQGSDGFGAKWWLVSPAGANVTASVTAFTAGSSGSGSSGSGSSGSGSSGSSPTPAPAATSSAAGGGWS